jgi:uncharacterized protein DUF5648
MSARFLARKGVVLAAVVLALAGLFRASAASAQTQTAVEYYYADWNFYFVTSDPVEIAALDGGAFGGLWKRTGQTFQVWSQPVDGALPTCRFFSTIFAPRSSHFYTNRADECAQLKQNSGWQFESIAFYLQPLNANDDCPVGTVILYRLFNNGMGGAPNHRFITDVAAVVQMVAAGWSLEGDGPKTAYACVPAGQVIPSPAAGFWDGTTNTNGSLGGVVLDDGTFYFLYVAADGSSGALVQGTATALNGQFTSSNAINFAFGSFGFGISAGSMAGTYASRAALNGTFTLPSGSPTFATTYDNSYEQPASLSDAAGTYSGPVLSTRSLQNTIVTFSATGAISATGPTCSFTGTATPHGEVNVLDVSITFLGGMCAFGTSSLAGVAFYDPSTGEILVMAVSASRTDAFLFIGAR